MQLWLITIFAVGTTANIKAPAACTVLLHIQRSLFWMAALSICFLTKQHKGGYPRCETYITHTLLLCGVDYALRFYMAGSFLPGFPNSSPQLLSPSKPPLCVSELLPPQALNKKRRYVFNDTIMATSTTHLSSDKARWLKKLEMMSSGKEILNI